MTHHPHGPSRLPDPDPFQPWRPPGYTPSVPRPEYKQPSRPDNDPLAELQSGSRDRPRSIQSSKGVPLHHRVVLLLLFGAVVLGVALLLLQGGMQHSARVISTLLFSWLGLALSISWLRRQRWWARLSWLGLGLLGAVLAWWFVPTLGNGPNGGVTLWEAHRQLNKIETLPAGGVADFMAGQQRRKEVVRAFPVLEANFKVAEQAWMDRTVDEVIRQAQQQEPDQAAVFLSQQTRQLHQTGLLRSAPALLALRRTRREVFRTRVTAVARKLRDLMARKEYVAVAHASERAVRQLSADGLALNEEGTLARTVGPIREQAFRARLNQAREKLFAQVVRDGFQGANKHIKKVVQTLESEANQVGMRKEIQDLEQLGDALLELEKRAQARATD